MTEQKKWISKEDYNKIKPVKKVHYAVENYKQALNTVPFHSAVSNTRYRSFIKTLLNILIGLLIASIIVFLKPFGWKSATVLIPLMVLIPLTHLTSSVVRLVSYKIEGLIDTTTAVIYPDIVSVLSILLFYFIFRGIKGSSNNGFYFIARRDLLKIFISIIGICGLLYIIGYNDNFLWELIISHSFETRGISRMLASLQGLYTTNWPLLMAGCMILLVKFIFSMLIPCILLLISLRFIRIELTE